MSSANSLLKKIRSRKAKVGIIGLGYVGLPLAHAFALKKFDVVGIDVNANNIKKIEKGQCYIADIESASFKKVVNSGKLKATTDFGALANVDVVIVCVPTPLNRTNDPDMSYIAGATEEIKERLHPGQLIILESTTYPGTTDEVILPKLEESKYKVGKDFFLCFSPERIDPGNEQFKTNNIPKVVGGITANCTKLGAELYSNITTATVPVSSSRTAEMTKLLENTFRIVNIGLINELAKVAGTLKVDIWEAVDAAKTKPFGYMPFYPGPGIGGHCIGVDPMYLSWKARVHGVDLHFIELARRMNADMPDYVVSQAVLALNKHAGKAVSRSKVLLLGMTYKKDVSDTRESPALEILHGLNEVGAKVSYHDPYVPALKHEEISLKSVPLTPANLKKFDLVVLTTDHSKFNYSSVVKNSKLVFDTRNKLKKYKNKNIVRL